MTTPNASAAARELARELLDRETSGATEVASLAAALQRAWARASGTLRHFVGEDGYSALLARALLRAGVEQPMLNNIPRVDASGIHLDVVSAVEHHGAPTARAGVESVLAALIEILSDLIGPDMVRNILDPDDHTQTSGGRRTQ
jgi:hypothetical protein